MIVICAELRKIIAQFVHNTIPFVASLQKKRNWITDCFYLFITLVAGTGIYAAVLPTIILFYPHPDYVMTVIAITFTCCFNILVGNFIKNLFGLPRPYGEGLWAPVPEKDFGFPSTHTINAIANTGFVVFALTDSIQYRIIFIIYVVCVSFSRMYMGVHSPADVCCGMLFGFIHLIFMVNFYQTVMYIHSLPLMLPIFFMIHVVILILMPRCKEYNPTPRRTAMICGCVFAASVVMSFDMQTLTTHILPMKEYIIYQIHRLPKFIFEYIVAISICLSLFGTIGFILPNIIMKLVEKSAKINNLLRRIEQFCCKYRIHCLKDNINEYECDKTMLKYTAEIPLAYFSGFVGGFCVVYVAPKVILAMNPEMILPN
ncbi:sphingosine-1-phosphate phosphohydrolase [Entamoeba histolytica HM-3:IMSS]|uniref:Sphingosine-1-phosphate phosphohydrolase n=1 Tax=Entamoeba histolytica HM-3:IMSS TaxID=885315 RepID=M7X0U3_ENTHI|nr:sphingosine-1-phosphate phosphohydrolase [Entamoeba histolytica HM-3:IMSS]